MMKKMILALMTLALAGCLASCGGGDGYRDGSYRAEAKNYDDHGWKEYVVVTVKDGKITEVEFDAVNKDDSRKKTEDDEYKEAYLGAELGTYPEDYTAKLEDSLIERQSADSVDTVAGATNSSKSFKKLVKALEGPMKKGKKDIVTVDTES
ncbi:MAG: FMN-binding protein [Oscillospiraceae bacterium]|jgi:major membrane immunogen (membrane-anchored lipoprotein)|nr:FMN-binding protein [Oscillospiraceae bacterium]